MFPLTFNGEFNAAAPVWAPDGKHLAFFSNAGMSWIRADGGGEMQTLLPGENVPSSFSSDGKLLAYYSRERGIWILPLDLSDPDHPKPQKPEVFLSSPTGEYMPAFSPDGHWIAYAARNGVEQNVWVRPYPGPGGRWPISSGALPTWSRTAQQ